MHICIECLKSPATHYQYNFCYECYRQILNDHIETKLKQRLKDYKVTTCNVKK